VGLTPDNPLSGAVGAVIVFVLTVVYGAVVRTLQRGRELVGLSRVIRPEMERNVDALDIIHQVGRQGGPHSQIYQEVHPIYDAWRDTRTRLAQLMPAHDFAILANFYEELELLDNTMQRLGDSDADREQAALRVDTCYEKRLDAMRVVDGYCAARWRLFAGWVPGDIE
jgi:hypothetical protein